MAASLQRSDQLVLMGDVPLPAMEKAFSLLKKLFQCVAVHGHSLAARIHAKAAFVPWSGLDTILTRSPVWLGTSRSSHDGPMKEVRGKTSPRSRGIHTALKNKQAAESGAHALASTIRKLIADGFASKRALAVEFNRRGVPTALGGS